MISTENIGPVQAGIPLPPKPGAKSAPVRAAIEELEVGESRLFSGVSSRKLQYTASTVRKILGRAFAVRQIGDVVRVWRTR